MPCIIFNKHSGEIRNINSLNLITRTNTKNSVIAVIIIYSFIHSNVDFNIILSLNGSTKKKELFKEIK